MGLTLFVLLQRVSKGGGGLSSFGSERIEVPILCGNVPKIFLCIVDKLEVDGSFVLVPSL